MPRPQPSMVSEADLDKRFRLSKLLKSGGDYGCGCALFEGDLEDEPDGLLLDDHWFYALNKQHADDVGTVLVTGSIRSTKELFVSDRLMCLVVLGSFEAPSLSIFETEVYVAGELRVGSLTDRDDYLTVKGKRMVEQPAATSEDEPSSKTGEAKPKKTKAKPKKTQAKPMKNKAQPKKAKAQPKKAKAQPKKIMRKK